MNDNITPRGMDRADTGQWRLVIYISRRSLEAWLQPLAEPRASRRIASVEWQTDNDGPELLRKIENAVYDYPQLLDDYSADIIIESDRTMWIPGEISDDEDRTEDEFCSIYKCEPEDMMIDTLGDKAVLWWLTPGLPAFLSRTFPGARIRSHQSVLLTYLEGLGLSDGELMILNTREGSSDIILMKEGKLKSIATQRAGSPEEAIFRLLRAAETYGFTTRRARLAVRDESGDDSELSDALDKLQLDATVLLDEELPIPTAALLTLLPKE